MRFGKEKSKWNHTSHILAFIHNSVSRKPIKPSAVNPMYRAPSSKNRPAFECDVKDMIAAFVSEDNPSRKAREK